MQRPDMIHIGIDTGRNTGFAVWDGAGFTELATLPIHRALKRVEQLDTLNPGRITLYIEDARKRKWIPHERNLSQMKGRAQGAGSVKRDASIWEDFAKDLGISIVLVPPKYNTTKLTPEYFSHITRWKGRTSEHARDAAMLVFGK